MKSRVTEDKVNVKAGTTIEVISDGIAEAFRLAQEHGCAEITLKIPVPRPADWVKLPLETVEETKEATVVDRLRARGTPIELIHSYLIAEDPQAQAAYRTSVLEALYERLAGVFESSATVRFENRDQLEQGSTTPYRVFAHLDADAIFYSLQLTPEHEDCIKEGSTTGHASVHLLKGGAGVEEIKDSAQATIIGSISRIVEALEQQVVDRCIEAVSNHGQGHFTFGIIPDMSTTHVELIEHKKIATSADIAMYGFYTKNP